MIRSLAHALAAGAIALLVVQAPFSARAAEKPLTPAEARQRVGQRVLVEMEVRAAKDRLEKRGEIYLDSEADFRDEKNLAIVITRRGAESLKDQGVTNPAEHFRNQKIRVQGEVQEADGVRRIDIDSADQIALAP